jgi:dTDP-4-dehydrorhamnose reductase
MLKKILQSKKKIFKYLIIGSNGLLGTEIKKILPKRETILVARNKSDYNLNLENFDKLEKLFENQKFSYVINTAAITDLNLCEIKKNKCKKINYLLPLKLNDLSKKLKFKLIQISTDQVYVSKNKRKNKEIDKTSYVNYYSKMKYLSEKKLKRNKNTLIVRTNFTGFKENGINTFISWLDQSILNKRKINLFNDLFCSTIDSKTCARLIVKLINLNKSGIFNLGTRDSLTKKEFAILYANKLKKKIHYKEISAKTLKLKRPLNLKLDTKKIEKALGIKMITSLKSINNLVLQKKKI